MHNDPIRINLDPNVNNNQPNNDRIQMNQNQVQIEDIFEPEIADNNPQ